MSRVNAAKIACLLHVRDTIGIASMREQDFAVLTAIDTYFGDVNARYSPPPEKPEAPARGSVEFEARPATDTAIPKAPPAAFEEPEAAEPGPDDKGVEPFNRTPTPGTLNDGGGQILTTLPPDDNPQPTPSRIRDPDAAFDPAEVGTFGAVFQPERVAPPITIPPQEAETLDTTAPAIDPNDPPPDYTQLAARVG